MKALERPLMLFRDINAPELPANLKGLFYEELDVGDANLDDRVHEKLSRQEPLHRLTGDRFLSVGVLRHETAVNDRLYGGLSSKYPTWQTFLKADNDEVARRVGALPGTIQEAKEMLNASDY